MEPVIFADLRCLQDPQFQFRGVGHHTSSLLRQRRQGPCASWRTVGLVDEALGALPPKYARLVDEISQAWNAPLPSRGAVFVDASPMTHDPRPTVRFTADRECLNAAVIYDFIPLDWPGYFPTIPSRIEYLAKVARLRSFDLYLPISDYSASRLAETLGTPKANIQVTGASVRSSLFEIRRHWATRSPYHLPGPYFLTVGGGDRRKNTESAVTVVRDLNQKYGRLIPLRVVGHYDEAYRADLIRLSGHGEGKGFLEFWPGVDDETLVDLYSGAMATICPSHIEGFDLPLVESLACGTPVIASTCGAHMALVEGTEALFQSDDPQALGEKLDRIWREPAWREQLVRQQCHVANRFQEEEVGARFWSAIADRVRVRGGGRRSCRSKPKVAFLTPYPPDQSGVARYTQLTIEAAAAHFSIDLYTDAERPLTSRGLFHDAGRINRMALFGAYDSVISVIGNSHFHIPVFEFFEQYGGPCILHDSRLTQIYHFRLGPKRFREFAGSILGRRISPEEVEIWLRDRDLPSLFVEHIAKKAKPLIVHTRQYQKLLRERFDIEAEVATFCPNMYFSEEDLRQECCAEARRRLGISPDVFLISTFGFAGKEKGMDAIVVATELLRGWKIPAELHFVGDTLGLAGEIQRVASMYGIEAHVHTMDGFVENQRYRNYMLASDAAVQLRNYGLGQPSAALADCISSALPCVASSELAASCDAPAYILTVPDRCSPLQVAEGLATIWEGRRERIVNRESQQAYLATHNFGYYVNRLTEILELA